MADKDNAGISAQLVAEDGTTYEIEESKTLGRSKKDDITFNNSKVSRGHAKLTFRDGVLTVEDLESLNGTSVNLKKIPPNEVTELRDGDIVSLHRVDLKVQIIGLEEDGDDNGDDSTVMDLPDSDAPAKDSDPEPAPKPAPTLEPDPEPAPEPPSDCNGEQDPETARQPLAAKAKAIMPGHRVKRPCGGSAKAIPDSYLKGEQKQKLTVNMTEKDIKVEDLAKNDNEIQVDIGAEGPHLVVLFPSEGAENAIVELEHIAGDKRSVWEIGRENTCQIVLDDKERFVSGRHLRLLHHQGQWQIIPMMPRNTTFVNGNKVHLSNKFIGNSDKIRIGRYVLVFHSGRAEEKPGPYPPPEPPDGTGSTFVRWIILGLGALMALLAGAYFFG